MTGRFAVETERLRSLVRRARHHEAFQYAEKLYRANPTEPVPRYLYAVTLGDDDGGSPPRRAERNRRESVRLLRPLLRTLKHFDAVTRYRIRNEYYWFSRQHAKQYRLGSEGLRKGYGRAAYSQGVGAAWQALKMAQAGRTRLAGFWARRSVRAWSRFNRRERYYNAYVHLGLAHGVLGETKEMERALERGARIAGPRADLHEFEDVRELVRRIPAAIRKASAGDAEAIVRVHFAAVRGTAGPFYPPEVLEGWSRKPGPKRYRTIRRNLAGGAEKFFVAEDPSGLLGFGVVVPGSNEVRALYVHPRAGRRAVGTALLRELERQARRHGVKVLRLNSSLNAQPFYQKNGYRAIAPGTHRLSNGVEMRCVRMKKTLV